MQTSDNPSRATIDRLLADLGEGMAADRAALDRSIDRLRRRGAPAAEIERVTRAVAASRDRARRRTARVPSIDYPPDLPVSARRDDIAQALRAHQVIIVCGETGSGKTTQLPKICLENGRGLRGQIGHTQPRRIAARSVATRIAQELDTPPGEIVGYKIRFSDQTKPDAFIKLMTDGILLAETQSDRLLAAYDTILIDEAHERSLNVDFLMGYLKQLLPRRPDLKLIITSATLDADRFARHFGDGTTNAPAPVIEVEGRMFPVEVRYRPLGAGDDPAGADEADDEEALEEAIVSTAEDLWREGPGAILVFLPGEREIRETAELLSRGLAKRSYASSVEILPLFARLSVEQQQQVFAPSRGRRIVLATNVAETSLTVPGIRYVIDSGLARIKRYSLRNKVTLLQIEKVSQAAANQRAGRCGRVAAGVCVRLYGAADFEARPRYTEPEILRSSLAAVILRMASLDLGDVASFPFPEAPNPRAIADGYHLLQELGAVDLERALTPLGRELAKLPVDPRIGRIILAAKDAGCLAEILVIASAMAVPDPRERPMEKRHAADQAHLRFRDERSDFLSLIALWQFFTDALAEKLPHRRLVERCRAHFVSYLRLREWRDLHRQLADQVAELGWSWSEKLPAAIDAPRYAMIHRTLLEGLLSNIGTKAEPASDGQYLGARGIKFHLHPGSGIAKKPPKWVLAAELTETTRLYARGAASIDPDWIEQVAGDRVDRTYFDPRWDPARGEVVGAERVALYGLTLVARRRVSYGRVDPATAREVFLREGLVAGALVTKGAFFPHNRKLVEDIAELEHKTRRQDVLVDDEVIHAFYAERIPADVWSAASFEHWRVDAERGHPRLLYMTREALMRHGAAGVTETQYPQHLDMGGARLPLKYRFAPDHLLDGLTLTVPLTLLNQVDAARLSWLVPGMIREKLTWYLKAMPKAWRQRLTPLPEVVTAFLEARDARAPAEDSGEMADACELSEALRAFCGERLGATLPADVWSGAELPAHLRVNVSVVDANGRELGGGRDLSALKVQFGEAAQLTFSAAGPEFERADIKTWDFGDLPESLTIEREGQKLTGYPALVEQGQTVSLKLLDTRNAADASTRTALLRLLKRQFKDALQRLEKQPPGFVQAALMLKPAMPTDGLLADAMAAICDRAFIGEDALPRSEATYADQIKRARVRLPAVAEGAFRLLGTIAVEYHALSQRIASLPKTHARLGADLRAQRDELVHPGFLSGTPWPRLAHLARYLKALQHRLAKYAENPARDAKHAQAVADFWQRYAGRRAANAAAGRAEPGLEAFRWQIEELKVSLFAQELRTPQPVSYKRMEKAWMELSRG